MKKLAIMRHAKSSWTNPELSDFDRPLNKRGLRDAPDMGERLATRGFQTQLIISSPAKRALVTARTIAEALDYPLDRIVEEPEFYMASPDTLIERVQTIKDSDIDVIMLFGHNPTFTFLANSLGDLQVDNMPTCSIAVFNLPISGWDELDYGIGELDFFDFPKNTNEL